MLFFRQVRLCSASGLYFPTSRSRKLVKRLNMLGAKFKEVEETLNSGKELNKWERSSLLKVYNSLADITQVQGDLVQRIQAMTECKKLLEDTTTEPEMRQLAEDEFQVARTQYDELEAVAMTKIVPQDEDGIGDAVILEIRAGAGGDEAALFVADLSKLYLSYFNKNRWKATVLNTSHSDRGGFKEVSIEVAGDNPFASLKYESGTHRVQRIPETEAQGRVHTSTATVAVLPKPEELQVKIEDKDLRIDFFRSSGPGGQSVNKTESAVRITHLPTNTVVSIQDERSQTANMNRAMGVLRARLFDLERQRRMQERASMRSSMVGSGERSERIRTYNFPQSRVTDHRVGETFGLDMFLNGESFERLVPLLQQRDSEVYLDSVVDE